MNSGCRDPENLKNEISQKSEDILTVDEIHVLLQDKNGQESFPEDIRNLPSSIRLNLKIT